MRKEANNGEEEKKAAVKLMKTIQLPRLGCGCDAWNVTQIKKKPENRNNVIGNA